MTIRYPLFFFGPVVQRHSYVGENVLQEMNHHVKSESDVSRDTSQQVSCVLNAPARALPAMMLEMRERMDRCALAERKKAWEREKRAVGTSLSLQACVVTFHAYKRLSPSNR